MADIYEELQHEALELIDEFGRKITLSRSVDGEYDPETGGSTGGSTETEQASVVILPASNALVQSFDIKFESGTLVESNLRALVIAAKGLEWMPSPGDKASFDGADWTFIGCTPINPAGTPLVYKASVKR